MGLKSYAQRFLGIDSVIRQQRQLQRDVTGLTSTLTAGSVDIACDQTTPRLSILRKKVEDGPFLAPTGDGWRGGAVFDGRPIVFNGRTLIYFCAQPRYRSDAQIFVGLAELRNDNEVVVHPAPVIAPDIELNRIDVPAFTVIEGAIWGVYQDGRDASSDMIVVRSADGFSFEKRRVKHPFRDERYDRIGLPWVLGNRVYMRAKRGSEVFLVYCEANLGAGYFGKVYQVAKFPRNPVNVAVTKRSSGYLLFYGQTVGGGLYVAMSDDGLAWSFDNERMLVSSSSEWGWDYYKVCGTPDNTEDDDVRLCYLSTNTRPCIGYGQFHVADLKF